MTRTASTLIGLHAQTALHPGAGTALGVVDLPVQRERHTGWPTIPGSALKGILRDRCRSQLVERDDDFEIMEVEDEDKQLDELVGQKTLKSADAAKVVTELFGPPTDWASEFAGALSVTDARLIAFPVRSMRGVFSWVTCRAALERLQSDAAMAGIPTDWTPQHVPEEQFAASTSSQCTHEENYLVLEEFDFERHAEADRGNVDSIASWLAEHIMTGVDAERVKRQLTVLNDDDFTHFAKHATEIATRIRLDYETKTVAKGQLFNQEFLPAETVMYSAVIANPSRSRKESQPTELIDNLRDLVVLKGDLPTVLQIGADETTGKGLCAVNLNSTSSPTEVNV